MNCLEHCLEQWLNMPDYRLWYNSTHVIIIEPEIDLHDKGYLPIEDYGKHINWSFKNKYRYKRLLKKYFDQ
jgi:hypothetical protein